MRFALSDSLTHGELFAGISGFGLGFEKAGIQTLWHVENNLACQSVLKRHYPDTAILGDIKDVGMHNLVPVNIISFGSPCQGLSVAGKREGLDDDRSNLFFEGIRVVDELKPDFAVWENVPGALSSNSGRDFAAVLSEFRRIGARDIAWRIIDAQYHGVPQRRRRIFLVADFRAERAAEVLFESESRPWDTPPSREAGAELAGAITPGTHPGSYNGQGTHTGHLIADTLRSGGKGGIPSSRGENLICFAPQAGGNTGLNINHNLSGTLQENQVMAVAYDGRHLNNTGEITSTLQSKKDGGYSLNYQPIIAYSETGPGWWRDGIGTLRERDYKDASNLVKDSSKEGVRRLTPLECERLQGFPDHHTAGQSDSARYRQLGNAVAVPVAEWLGRRIERIVRSEND